MSDEPHLIDPAPGPRSPSSADAASAIDGAPFIAWAEQRIRDHDDAVRRDSLERGLEPPKVSGAVRAVLRDIHWLTDIEQRRMARWLRREPGVGAYIDEQTGIFMVPAEQVEAALEHAGVPPWELYPELAAAVEDVREAFCPTCSDEVTLIDGVCPWCETLVVRPHATARCGPPTRRRPRVDSRPRQHKPASLAGLEPTPRPDPLALVAPLRPPREPRSVDELRHGMPEQFVRDAMHMYLDRGQQMKEVARVLLERHPGRWANERSLSVTLRGVFRRRGVAPSPGVRRWDEATFARERELIERYLAAREPGYAYDGSLPPDAVWEAAYRYYLDGWGHPRIARHLLARSPWLPSANANALAKALFTIWRINGWPTRSQREASRVAQWRHGMSVHAQNPRYRRHQRRKKRGGVRPQCDALSRASGKRCCNLALPTDTKCFRHSEQTIDARKALAAKRNETRRRELVDAGPFLTWVRGRVEEYGSITATARVLGIYPSLLTRILRDNGTTVPGKLTRRVIERALAAALENDEQLVVPRFSDLYEVVPPSNVVSLPLALPEPELVAA